MSNGNETKDFALTIDFAKRLAMMAKTEKGEQARKYFIECEKQLKEQQVQLPNFTNPAEAAIAWAEEYKAKEIALAQRDEAIRTKAHIGSKREQTAMTTASVATRTVEKLKNIIGIGEKYKTVKAIKGWDEFFNMKEKKMWGIIGRQMATFYRKHKYPMREISESGYDNLIKTYHTKYVPEFFDKLRRDKDFMRKHRIDVVPHLKAI